MKILNQFLILSSQLLAYSPTISGFLLKTLDSRQALCFRRNYDHSLYAENGPPKYDKTYGKVANVEKLGSGTVMIHVEHDVDLEYEPGHVFALEIQKPENVDVNQKNSDDAVKNEGWLRGPYTISRAKKNTFDVMMKVVGDKSKSFYNAVPGTSVRFGGKFHTPILEGIDTRTTKRVVMISTGVGVGPCVGAVELALENSSFPPIELYSSYRMEDEVIYSQYLNDMAIKYPTKFFWKPIITSKIGRLSATTKNVEIITTAPISATKSLSLLDTHYHLIGNGQMVNEWKSGLSRAGVPDEKITVESYFNHKEATSEDAISNISNVISSSYAN